MAEDQENRGMWLRDWSADVSSRVTPWGPPAGRRSLLTIRPPLGQAGNDPLGYARALCQASGEAELIDADGLGGFGWLVQAVDLDLPASLARLGGPPA